MSKIKPDPQIYVEEYKSLRDETIKRVELGKNIINLNFIAVGGLVLIGTAIGESVLILLLYPLLAFFFSLAYTSNAIVIAEIGNYIREGLEKKIWELRWATYYKDRNPISHIHQIYFVVSIFGVTSIISLILAFSMKSKILEWYASSILFIVAIIATLGTWGVLIRLHTYHPVNIVSKLQAIEKDKDENLLIK